MVAAHRTGESPRPQTCLLLQSLKGHWHWGSCTVAPSGSTHGATQAKSKIICAWPFLSLFPESTKRRHVRCTTERKGNRVSACACKNQSHAALFPPGKTFHTAARNQSLLGKYSTVAKSELCPQPECRFPDWSTTQTPIAALGS